VSDAIDKHLASAKELILGFDAGCSSCSGIATRIEERIGDKLVIRNLRDPELMEWRREALGEAAPWAPTLFEVEGGHVRAWVGMKMGLALSRRLGPKDTWRVMQVLGEMGAAPNLTDKAVVEALPSETREAAVGMSRGQFLKGVGGATVAASILSGGSFASPALATTTNPEQTVKRIKLTGTTLTRIAREAALQKDVRNIVGTQLSTAAQISAAKPTAVEHRLKNGNRMLAVSFVLPNSRFLLYHQYVNRPVRGAQTQSTLWQGVAKRLVLVNASEGRQPWRNPNPRTAVRSGGTAPLSECLPATGGAYVPPSPPNGTGYYNQCGGREGYFTQRVCVRWDPKCAWEVAAIGSGCATALVTGPVGSLLVAGGCLAATQAHGYEYPDGCCVERASVQRPCNVPACSVCGW
jgi:hypothetical protein